MKESKSSGFRHVGIIFVHWWLFVLEVSLSKSKVC